MSGSEQTRLSFELRWKIEDGTEDADEGDVFLISHYLIVCCWFCLFPVF